MTTVVLTTLKPANNSHLTIIRENIMQMLVLMETRIGLYYSTVCMLCSVEKEGKLALIDGDRVGTMLFVFYTQLIRRLKEETEKLNSSQGKLWVI